MSRTVDVETADCILAVFQPQAWFNDYAIDIDGRQDVDVTERVLALPLVALHALEDHDDPTDGLVDHEELGHLGPYYVEVTDAICAFFNVERLIDITEPLLLQARARYRENDAASNLVLDFSPRVCG